MTYRTIKQAEAAVEAAIKDTLGDNPDMVEDEVAHDLIISVAYDCAANARYELLMRNFGMIPDEFKTAVAPLGFTVPKTTSAKAIELAEAARARRVGNKY